MKATVTIEIEGTKKEINDMTKRLSHFVKRQPQRTKLNFPISNMYPKGYAPRRKW